MQVGFGATLILITQCLSGFVSGRMFAYERGKCENSIFNALQDMFKMELRAIINPRFRYSNTKLLGYDLYTPLNPYKRQVLRPGDVASLQKSYFNPKWPVRFSIHGWTGKSTHCSNAAIKDAYLSRGNYNVIVVDWSIYSLDISYSRLSKQLSAIAAALVKFVRFLHQTTGAPYEQMYLVGHSAGSHISGLAGKLLKPQRFGAIFALDPAGLSQLNLGPRDRLAPDDAIYVESIHSDITLLGNPSVELSQASFFANWGQGQPQCPNATAAEFDFACDHFAALYYFAQSIRDPKMFGALGCDSQQSITTASCGCRQDNSKDSSDKKTCTADGFMGGEPAVPKSGIYYFSTKRQPPYGHGDGLVHMRTPIESTILESSVLPRGLFRRSMRPTTV
ncbi:lipase member H [Scaptodrosophila lebanonensis]|uniref:Lipase member H n=1 Tax=Drosophila lebanonensis TaxID=7225 RepID=A0A6J2TGH0_DROLE|nr:lipase member H [Scaptodrosophila lebanonensis]